MVMWLIPLAVMAACAAAEYLHWRRARRVAYLAFGEAEWPLRCALVASALRTVAAGALGWGLYVLCLADSSPTGVGGSVKGQEDEAARRLVIALDVSPSMQVPDAGPIGQQTRADRARDLLRSILDRVDPRGTRVSVVAFFTNARPVVIDTIDPDVVANILDDLPLEHAFARGKTNMYDAVQVAADIGRTWSAGSATLVLCSDGDTLPAESPPSLPASFGGTLVIGVGDPYRGTYIDGHSSRQNTEMLNRLALRLSGDYRDGNNQHVPTVEIQKLLARMSAVKRPSTLRLVDAAICAAASGAGVLALVSPALAMVSVVLNFRQRRRLSPFAPRKDARSFAERKATLVAAPPR